MTETEIERLARTFAKSTYLHQLLKAKISCASIQYGHHIDTLARDAPEPTLNLPVCKE